VIGATTFTNTRREEDKTSPIYGMAGAAGLEGRTVMFIKRSLAPAMPHRHPLFYRDNT